MTGTGEHTGVVTKRVAMIPENTVFDAVAPGVTVSATGGAQTARRLNASVQCCVSADA